MAVNVDRTFRLPDSEYFPDPQRKPGIAIHHTVCDSARKTVAFWCSDKSSEGDTSHVATAYVIDRDGTIFEAFDPDAWAYQFGLSWPEDQRIPFEKRFIGIEITSEGGLLFDCGTDYRG
ncbi:MAG: N-acetylmuramoyl-L-alanine amidase [Gemmatimonadetes bacterium]|nr:N-acetylmuramoyl-L-alanine amidase [Gemmatimonadota bacterium]